MLLALPLMQRIDKRRNVPLELRHLPKHVGDKLLARLAVQRRVRASLRAQALRKALKRCRSRKNPSSFCTSS